MAIIACQAKVRHHSRPTVWTKQYFLRSISCPRVIMRMATMMGLVKSALTSKGRTKARRVLSGTDSPPLSHHLSLAHFNSLLLRLSDITMDTF